MNNGTRKTVKIALAAACVAGFFLAALGLGSYLIRYGHLDGLEGTIPDSLYGQVVGMFGVEKLLLLFGLLLALGCGVALVVSAARRGRAASTP